MVDDDPVGAAGLGQGRSSLRVVIDIDICG
jgi:hypothetical protein